MVNNWSKFPPIAFITMISSRKKIRRKFTDFFSPDDIFEPKFPPTNLSISDLDAKGHLVNPKAPCVVTTIDPTYTKDANRQQNFHNFRVKSDILRLREITRKKFLLYVTQQRALEKARDQEFHLKIFERTKYLFNMASQQLTAIEDKSLYDMLAENERLKKLQSVQIAVELEECTQTHQRLSMEVKNIHKRFIFLLKLIGYFDEENDETISILKLNRLNKFTDCALLKSDLLASYIVPKEIAQLKQFLTDIVRPYLRKRTYLNADTWIAGYEYTRHKLFQYYDQYTKLAILNHLVVITHEKFIKSHQIRVSKPVVHKTSSYLKERKIHLKNKANQVLELFEKKYLQSKLHWHIKGVAPVLLEKVEGNVSKKNEDNKINAISKLEQIHVILMGFLIKLDTLEPDFSKQVEKEVRRRIAKDKNTSRKVLAKVNRFDNWIAHYKKHLEKNN